MAGNARYDLSSASSEELGFTGSYSNGQRGSYPSASFDRSGSFSESRMFSSGASTPRASASPARGMVPLAQYLSFDQVTMGDQKFTRTGELRRALGISPGSPTEDNSFGAAHSKPPLQNRIKKWNGCLLRCHKLSEELNSKNQQRNEMLMNERSGGSNFLKVGTQIHRNPSDLGTQRLEDRTKTPVLNKRVRSSVAELRADGRSNTVPRQPLVMGKDRDMHRDGGEVSDLAEEKVRRLPAGGEGWDRKMKKKRSVGPVFTRNIDSDGEVKRVVHHKFNNEPGLQPYDAQSFRSGSFNGSSGINKLDGVSASASSNVRAISKESEKASMTRDFASGMNKERLVVKANNKVNTLEDNNHTVSPSPVTKGKASRTPRTGSVTAVNASPNISRMPGALDGWEQTPGITKGNSVGGPNNRKRPLPAGSSSPPMAQWVGQRPQKISRTRRVNVVSPVSNHDEGQMSSERGHISEFSSRASSAGINGLPLAKDLVNGNKQVRVKHENVSSPSRLSESEESGAGENHEGKPKEKGTGSSAVEERSLNQNVVPSLLLTKKNKILNKEDTGDGVRRQGRTGRGALSSRISISPMRENMASTKPLRSTRPISDKSGSKTGRPPLKKIADRKALARLGQTPISGSPDSTGESDDDREELLAAANFSCNPVKMEPVFAPICSEDLSFLKQHDDLVLEEDIPSHLVHEESEENLQDQGQPKFLVRTSDLVNPDRDNIALCGGSRRNNVTPLYQRVLSALIVEDESEEFAENSGGRNISFQYTRDNSPGDSCLPIDSELGSTNGIDFNYESKLSFQSQKQSSLDGFSCNGSTTINRTGDFHKKSYNDHLVQESNGFMHLKTGMFPGLSENNDKKPSIHSNAFGISAYDCPYEELDLEDKLLMELQSVGLYPETVPDLADGEDEVITQDIIELKKKLHQVVGKEEYLDKVTKAIKEGRETQGWPLEQVAMDRLVELAYRKQLATRGSSASKFGVPKVSKQVALAFTKRTLAKCRKFEDTGKSCFCEPPLRDVIFAAPPTNVTESTSCIQDPGTSGCVPGRVERHDLSNDKLGRGALFDQDFARTGPILNRGGKKKELLLDDVGGNALFKATSSLGNTPLGGAKGKRSERERDKDVLARNSVTRAGRASQSNIKGDRKTKSKPKQKIVQLSTSGDGIINKFKDTGSNKKREAGATSNGSNPVDSAKEGRGATNIAKLQELDPIELHEGNDFGDTQDLNNLFDGLPENDLGEILLDDMPLQIPMDDLSTILR
ncbi:spectrin beta chain, brain [Salix suchowensis]|nr:spectrin beta chain, brain [Salix suchowensis]